ncbi:MAG: MotA/TolQ/ExbB proton channel family protein [Pseudomonadota bacterium]
MSLLDGFANPVVWFILLVAFGVFAWLFELLLQRPRDGAWLVRARDATPALRTLVATLPLLGLLGTIVGLLETFTRMSVEYGFDPTSLVSGGIADAMFTTQMGLLMAIPGWVLLTWLQAAIDAVGDHDAP